MNENPIIAPTEMPAAQTDPERWVDEHGDCLFRYALVRVRSREIAEDLVQDTLLAAVRQMENFGGRSSERSWLCGILKHKISDYFRKLGRETNFTDLQFFSDEHSDRFDADGYWIHERGPSEWKPEGETAVRQSEFRQALRDGLARLPERIAQAFVMREMDDVPSREICQTLNISEANLWVMLHRARMALREILETEFFQDERGSRL